VVEAADDELFLGVGVAAARGLDRLVGDDLEI